MANYSAANLSTKPLAAGETYTGQWELNIQPDVACSCLADTPGTLYFDFSDDRFRVDTFPEDGFKIEGDTHGLHTAVKLFRYFRVRYTNGPTDQSLFRLFVYYGLYRQQNAPLNQPFALDADATLVRPSFPWLDVARGLTSGVRFINNFGRNDDTQVGDSIWAISTSKNYPSTASTCDVSSDSADDDASGSGAQQITISGLDGDYGEISEIVSLDGLTPVTTVNSYFVVNTTRVSSAGSGGTAAGNITITSNDTGNPVMDYIPVGFNRSQSADYTIPAGHTGYFNMPQVTLVNTIPASTMHIALFNKRFDSGVEECYANFLLQDGTSAGRQVKEFGAPLAFSEKDTILWKVITSSGGGVFRVSINYDLWLVNEVAE